MIDSAAWVFLEFPFGNAKAGGKGVVVVVREVYLALLSLVHGSGYEYRGTCVTLFSLSFSRVWFSIFLLQ